MSSQLVAPHADTSWTPGAGLPPAQLRRFVLGLAAEPRRWRHLVRHEHDVRVYEQIFSDARVNAWLICWSGGQDTGFHDHDESAGAISVIEGGVREERLVVGAPPVVREFAAGQHFEVPPTAIHRVLHNGARPAITIHAYSPPLLRMGAYRQGPGGELERQALTCEQELCAERGLDLLAGAPESAAPASASGATSDARGTPGEATGRPASAAAGTPLERAVRERLSERTRLVSYRGARGTSLAMSSGRGG